MRDIELWLGRNSYSASTHIVDVMVKILMLRDKQIEHAGGFVTAFVNNDLRMSFGNADPDCRANMHLLVMAYWNIDPPIETWTPAKQSVNF